MENLPPHRRRRQNIDEQSCCCHPGEIKWKGIGKRNQFPLSLSSCTLCFCLPCLYRQIIVLSFLLWIVPLNHLWNGGCIWLFKGYDPADKSVYLPDEVPALFLLYRCAPEHTGSESALEYLEAFLRPFKFNWGQSRLLKLLSWPWQLRHNPFHGTCRRSANFTILNRPLWKGCPGVTLTTSCYNTCQLYIECVYLWGLLAERKKKPTHSEGALHQEVEPRGSGTLNSQGVWGMSFEAKWPGGSRSSKGKMK